MSKGRQLGQALAALALGTIIAVCVCEIVLAAAVNLQLLDPRSPLVGSVVSTR